jgi:hypothetical protein
VKIAEHKICFVHKIVVVESFPRIWSISHRRQGRPYRRQGHTPPRQHTHRTSRRIKPYNLEFSTPAWTRCIPVDPVRTVLTAIRTARFDLHHFRHSMLLASHLGILGPSTKNYYSHVHTPAKFKGWASAAPAHSILALHSSPVTPQYCL